VVHGLLNPNANDSGDLPNIFADSAGSATAEIYSTLVSFQGGSTTPSLLDTDGSAVVIHANADDHTSQPIGGAGGRVACAVIR
jgi:Cu-Zn family superoxide dismutase